MTPIVADADEEHAVRLVVWACRVAAALPLVLSAGALLWLAARHGL